jgi:hypothetical protein
MVTLKFVPTASAQNSAINVVRCLGKHVETSRKQHSAFTSKFVPEYQSYGLYRIRTVRTVLSASVSMPFFLLYEIQKSVQYDLSAWTVPCLDLCACSSCCTACSIHTVRPAFNVVLAASISVLVCSLGMRALALQKWLPLQT